MKTSGAPRPHGTAIFGSRWWRHRALRDLTAPAKFGHRWWRHQALRGHTAPAMFGSQVVNTSGAPRPHGTRNVRVQIVETSALRDLTAPAQFGHRRWRHRALHHHTAAAMFGPQAVETSSAPRPHCTHKVWAQVVKTSTARTRKCSGSRRWRHRALRNLKTPAVCGPQAVKTSSAPRPHDTSKSTGRRW